MTDRSVIRFAASDAAYIAEILRGTYKIVQATLAADSEDATIIGDFIEALENDDSIEIVDDEDMLAYVD